ATFATFRHELPQAWPAQALLLLPATPLEKNASHPTVESRMGEDHTLYKTERPPQHPFRHDDFLESPEPVAILKQSKPRQGATLRPPNKSGRHRSRGPARDSRPRQLGPSAEQRTTDARRERSCFPASDCRKRRR